MFYKWFTKAEHPLRGGNSRRHEPLKLSKKFCMCAVHILEHLSIAG